MTEEQVRIIIRQELEGLLKSDRYTFEKTVQLLDGRNIQVGKTTGSMFGTETTQKIGFLGKTPVVRQATPVLLGDVIAVLQAFGFVA